ncbi:hypothetical protein QN277_008496 [Acacia crassicarpa]|uniref:C2H2-type domain-containing protein n=1 Tax=Acacia crassicarpa TaxID=499986 RepID=A0AAE1IRK0_9FABA|nr:hypothetical protein QN277_008496 [Acacia crassicarpa]
MAGKLELGFPKTSACSLREQLARKILRNVRSQGHPYVDLRDNGKKFIYFCTLCLAPCYSDTALFDHLKGNLHMERLSAAKVTLLGPNPWPFNDGVVFFDTSIENEDDSPNMNAKQKRLLEYTDNDNNLAIVKFGENLNSNDDNHAEVHGVNGSIKYLESGAVHSDLQLSSSDGAVSEHCTLVIPHALIGDKTPDLQARDVGLGKIAVRFFEKDGGLNGIRRIWCEWLGKDTDGHQVGSAVPEHKFAVIIFSYHSDLGRNGSVEELKSLLPSTPMTELENESSSSQKRKKSFSDPEDVSDSLSNQYDSSVEDSSASSSATSRLALGQIDNQLLHTRFISSKAIRKELRRKQRLAAEKMCDICKQKMLPGRDVATLFNLKTRRLACSSRNGTGAFHLFHASCLVHWILMCEYNMIPNHVAFPKVRRRSKRKMGANANQNGKEYDMKAARGKINSVFCPECQGTGIIVDGDQVEHAPFSLSEMFKLKIKACDGRREWIRSPELLQNCSTGFHFPAQSEEIGQERVKPIKLLHFYRVDEQNTSTVES